MGQASTVQLCVTNVTRLWLAHASSHLAIDSPVRALPAEAGVTQAGCIQHGPVWVRLARVRPASTGRAAAAPAARAARPPVAAAEDARITPRSRRRPSARRSLLPPNETS